MPVCPVCARSSATLTPRCPLCGAVPSDSVAPTVTTAGEPDGSRTSLLGDSLAPHLPRGGPRSAGAFAPGHLLAGRYRVVALLGSGGMGDVYRADDLELEHPVALKLLPDTVAQDPDALARMRREVRTARQVSHPNVCRVFDIGEADGGHFITMEYIDGEDLASLLRRIGRCPNDKALEIARQLCAGLAAAHGAGVLHRDLKPGNVMIDGRGQARLTDFGLAGLAEELRQEKGLAGTPGYMAPEQLDGRPASVKSDLYALGLVLFELWSGRRAFTASDLASLRARQREGSTPSLSSLVPDIPPAVERAIERCLAPDPARRPHSALQVAAMLPGGDPLAAALARGETPSPDLVAAAVADGTLSPRTVLGLGALFLLLLGLIAGVLSDRFRVLGILPAALPPEVLADRAASLLRALDSGAAADSALGFVSETRLARYLQDSDPARTPWSLAASGQPALMSFWYRVSPAPLVPWASGTVTRADPPLRDPGEARVELDLRGRLLRLARVPAPGTPPDAAVQPDFAPLLAAAGLDPARLKPGQPRLVPAVAADARQAWDGPHPDHPRLPIHVEAGAWQGKPVSFELRGPWDEEAIPETPYARRADVAMVLFTAVVALVVGTGVLMAWRNLAAGRGDRRGALRLGLFVFGITLLCHLLTSHVPPLRSGVIDSLWSATRLASAAAVCLSTFYLAAEPHVRRRWPRLLVSWSRMIGGDFRDPLVGRDVLAGALLGVAHTTTIYSAVLVEKLATSLKERSLEFRAELLASPLHALAGVLGSVNSAITAGFLNLLLILLLLLLLRRERLVMVAFFAVYVTLDVLFFARSWVYAVPVLLIPLLATAASLRFGLLTTMVFHLTFLLTFFMAFTTRLSAWYFGRGLVPLAATVLLALWGGWVALGPQKLFAADEV